MSMSQPEHSRELLGLRLIWMLLFLFVWLGAQYVLAVVVLVQLVVRLIKGEANPGLTAFGAALGSYLAQIVRFGTFASEVKPWPFADWPATEQPDDRSATAP
ncbi:DUF4389 domain-containing protein [Pseudomonas sp. BaP3]|nr:MULTISPECIES: DUF4389 domain-containing protein [Pseudomonas]MDC7828488.1 DUF4389 domain-containing protein [Pseudomonas benzopyrenica]HJE70441.1 DUF4389 domain-containing protein [Pseudomonas oryzihabitans]